MDIEPDFFRREGLLIFRLRRTVAFYLRRTRTAGAGVYSARDHGVPQANRKPRRIVRVGIHVGTRAGESDWEADGH